MLLGEPFEYWGCSQTIDRTPWRRNRRRIPRVSLWCRLVDIVDRDRLVVLFVYALLMNAMVGRWTVCLSARISATLTRHHVTGFFL